MNNIFVADSDRYNKMEYRRCGNSGLLLPVISLGLWMNFGNEHPLQHQREIIYEAFNNGITHFDLANNYGMPYIHLAEQNFGRILKEGLMPYRDELIISTKAGFDCWEGPYGNWGSRKYLFASLHRSLKYMNLDYVDIFYHHRFDSETPLEETCMALTDMVRQGKALYVGISNYDADNAKKAIDILRDNKTPCLLVQPLYNMLHRDIESDLLPLLRKEKVGCIAYSPLAQGALTDKYLNGIPDESRAGRKATNSISEKYLTEENLIRIRKLNDIAAKRGQSLAMTALAYLLSKEGMTSVIIGASSVQQLKNSLQAKDNIKFSVEELAEIDAVLS